MCGAMTAVLLVALPGSAADLTPAGLHDLCVPEKSQALAAELKRLGADAVGPIFRAGVAGQFDQGRCSKCYPTPAGRQCEPAFEPMTFIRELWRREPGLVQKQLEELLPAELKRRRPHLLALSLSEDLLQRPDAGETFVQSILERTRAKLVERVQRRPPRSAREDIEAWKDTVCEDDWFDLGEDEALEMLKALGPRARSLAREVAALIESGRCGYARPDWELALQSLRK